MLKYKTELSKAGIVILFLFLAPSFAIAYPAQGDWMVTGIENLQNENITLNGNLIVSNGGSLTLRKTNLTINNSYSGQFNIIIQPGGKIIIDDCDIKPSNLSYSFGISIEEGSIVLSNSRITGVGYISQDDEIIPTLEVVSVRNALIKGNNITNVASLIFRLNHVTDSEISDNTVETLKEANDPFPWALALYNSKNNIISNNSITGVYTGIGLENQSTNNYVAFNTIRPGTAGHLGSSIFANSDSNNNKFYSNIISGPTG